MVSPSHISPRVEAPGAQPAAAALERWCRRLLLAYPLEYRQLRGEELVALMLDVTGPGRRLPRWADAADLVANGLWRRVGTGSRAGLAGGLATVAPIGLAIAAGISLFALWRVEPAGLRTVGPIGYAAWLLAAAGWLLPRPAQRRAGIGVAIAVTLLMPALAVWMGMQRPPVWVLMALCAFGGLALAGTAPAVGRRERMPMDERLAVPAGAVAVAVSSSAVMAAWPGPAGGFGYYYAPTIARVGVVVGLAVAVLAAAAVHLLRRGGNALPWLWATVLLGLPAGWLGPFGTGGLQFAANQAVPRFGRLAQVLLGTSVAIIAMAWLGRRRGPGVTATGRGSSDAVRMVGWGMVSFDAGLLSFLAAGWSGLVGFADRSPPGAISPHVVITLSALGAAGLCGIAAAPARRSRATGSRRCVRTGGLTSPLVWLATGFLLAMAAGWLVASYDNNWTLGGWTDFTRTSGLVMTLAFLPFTWSVIVAAQTLATGGAIAAAAGMVAVAVGWIGYVAVPYLLLWGPVLVIMVAAAAVLLVSRSRGPSRSGLPG